MLGSLLGLGGGWRTRLLMRRLALGLIGLALILAGFVFLMVSLYEGFLIIAPPAAAALAVAALSFGAGGAVVAVLAMGGGAAPPPAPAGAGMASGAGLVAPLMSILRLQVLAKLLRARPLAIIGTAIVAGGLAGWLTRSAASDEDD